MKKIPHAFTLPELLTVLAILAVLAALILAALSSGKGEAQAAACRNNLEQIGRALAVYTADFGKYPGTHELPFSFPADNATNWEQVWDHKLLACASGNASIFICPVGLPRHTETYYSLTNYSYGYNAYGTGVQPFVFNLGLGREQISDDGLSGPIMAVTESQIRAPSDMIAVGDLNDLASLFVTTIRPVSYPPYAGTAAARHNAGANMVFCDGHTGYAKQKDWVEETDNARRRWNNDHEPHPETW